MNKHTGAGIAAIVLLNALTQAQTTSTTTQPAVLVTRPVSMLASVDQDKEGKSADDRVNQLIRAHNAKIRNIIDINLSGQCVWFKGGKPRAISIAYDIATQTGQLTCGPNDCSVDHDVVTMKHGSAMHVDALYFVMFRTFDPAQFTKYREEKLKIDDQEIDCILVDGQSEAIWFSVKTGNPVRLLTSAGDARFSIDYDTKSVWPAAIVPMKMTITLPPWWFGFKLDKSDVPIVTLDVDPTTVQVTEAEKK